MAIHVSTKYDDIKNAAVFWFPAAANEFAVELLSFSMDRRFILHGTCFHVAG